MTQLDHLHAILDSTISPMDYLNEKKTNPDAYFLFDVRNAPPDKKKEKIVDAVEIPLHVLAERLDDLPREKTILVYCWDVWCNMVKHASVLLLENGFAVKELSGGIAAWNTLQLPTVTL